MRPYITVSKIPNFDHSELPYYDIYKREGTMDTIQVGGTLAGEYTAGLSGGQRKLLLFELIYQRTKDHSELLIVLDEPFAGVTDDFVPHIVNRLNDLRANHNTLGKGNILQNSLIKIQKWTSMFCLFLTANTRSLHRTISACPQSSQMTTVRPCRHFRQSKMFYLHEKTFSDPIFITSISFSRDTDKTGRQHHSRFRN